MKLVGAQKEARREGGQVCTSSLVMTVAMNQLPSRSYREVLQQSRVLVPLREQNRPGGRAGMSGSLSRAVGPVKAGCAAGIVGTQRHDGGGRCAVGLGRLAEEGVYRTLTDTKNS